MSPIARVRGRLEERGPGWAIIDIGGIGLQVFLPAGALEETALGTAVDLYTFLSVREDQLTLYGFTSRQARDLFEMLLSVSGVGPKGALAVLSAFSPDDLAVALAAGDVDRLRRVPGIGAKTASRLVLEMRERLQRLGIAAEAATGGQDEVVAALIALGYSASEATAAARAVAAGPAMPLEERIRRALQQLSSR